MRVYGQLISAQLENKTSDYAGTITGMVWLHTTEGRVKFSNGASVVALLANDGKAVLGTNGTAGNNVRLHRGANTLLQFVVGSDVTAEGTLSTALAQISARQENYTIATRPAAGNPGRMIWNTDLGAMQADNGTTWESVGSGSGGGTSGIETLAQKMEAEKYGILTEALDNSVSASGLPAELSRNYAATLLKDHAGAVSTLEVVLNAKALNDSDQNYDATTNWGVTGAGASLTASVTAGDFQVGTAGLKFDKNATATEAGIRYDRGAQNLQLNGNSRAWVYVKLPSITDLSNVLLRVYADTTANFQTFTTTLDYAGNALAIGWNLLLFDISTGGSAGGTGWDISKLVRYCEVAVTTGLSTQTYTGICVDSLYFSYYRPQDLGVIGNQFTLFNNSTKEDVLFTAANTRHDGPLALAAATANAYNGGLSGTARGRVHRTTLASLGDGVISMDNDATFSGAITTAQEIRMASYARGNVDGDLNILIDMLALQSYEVTSVGGSTIGVSDPSNQSANLLNTDPIDIFRPVRINGKTQWIFRTAQTLTANSSHLSGTTTLTLTTTGIQVGDMAVKRHVTAVSHSVVTESLAENFSASTLLVAPNGIQLIDDSLPYPNVSNIYAHYALGSFSQADAIRNRFPGSAGATLTVNGVNNTGASFQRGRFSVEGSNSSSTQLQLSLANSAGLDGSANKIQYAMWFYFNGVDGANRRGILGKYTSPNGFYVININGTSSITMAVNNTEVTMHSGSIQVGWNHLVVVLNDSSTFYTYLNGVRSANHSQTFTPAASAPLDFLSMTSPAYYSTGLKAADVLIWKDGPTLTSGQVLAMYNNGLFREIGSGLRARYRYQGTGVVGQKISTKINIARSTTAITPVLWKAGSIIT